MWSAMTPAIFKYIAVHCIDTDTSRVKKVSRKNFKDMLARTPDIGGFMKNPLRICLSGGLSGWHFKGRRTCVALRFPYAGYLRRCRTLPDALYMGRYARE